LVWKTGLQSFLVERDETGSLPRRSIFLKPARNNHPTQALSYPLFRTTIFLLLAKAGLEKAPRFGGLSRLPSEMTNAFLLFYRQRAISCKALLQQ